MIVNVQPRLGHSRRGNSRAIVQQRLAALGYGDSGIDWGSIITAGINQAGSVAKVAVTPPMYSSVVNPLTGASSVTSYGGSPTLGTAANSLLSSSSTSLLSSPLILLFGLGLVAVLLLRR